MTEREEFIADIQLDVTEAVEAMRALNTTIAAQVQLLKDQEERAQKSAEALAKARAQERAAREERQKAIAQTREQAEQQRHAEAQQARQRELTAESTGTLLEMLGDPLLEMLGDPINPLVMAVSAGMALAGLLLDQLSQGLDLYTQRNERAEAASLGFARGLGNVSEAAVSVGDRATDMSTKVAGLGAVLDMQADRLNNVVVDLGNYREELEYAAFVTFGSFSPALIASTDNLQRVGVVALDARDDAEDLTKTVITLTDGFGGLATIADMASAAMDGFDAKLREIEEKWDDPLDGGVLGIITGAGTRSMRGGGKVNEAVKRNYQETLGNLLKDLERSDREAARLGRLPQNPEWAGDVNASLEAAARRVGALEEFVRNETDLWDTLGTIQAEAAEQQRMADASARVTDVMHQQVEAAVSLGLAMASLALTTAIAGDSFDGFGWKLLDNLGAFAVQAGEIITLTSLGLEALFTANPLLGLIVGPALIAAGAAVSGAAQRNLKSGGGGGSRTGAAVATRSVLDSFGQRGGGSDDTEQNVVVIAQFGADRLEPTFTRVVRSAQRNGRLPQSFGRV